MKAQKVFQYAVDVQPAHDSKNAKKSFLDQHHELLGKYFIFDGQMLFVNKNLGPSTHFASTDRHGYEYQITLM